MYQVLQLSLLSKLLNFHGLPHSHVSGQKHKEGCKEGNKLFWSVRRKNYFHVLLRALYSKMLLHNPVWFIPCPLGLVDTLRVPSLVTSQGLGFPSDGQMSLTFKVFFLTGGGPPILKLLQSFSLHKLVSLKFLLHPQIFPPFGRLYFPRNSNIHSIPMTPKFIYLVLVLL